MSEPTNDLRAQTGAVIVSAYALAIETSDMRRSVASATALTLLHRFTAAPATAQEVVYHATSCWPFGRRCTGTRRCHRRLGPEHPRGRARALAPTIVRPVMLVR